MNVTAGNTEYAIAGNVMNMLLQVILSTLMQIM